MGNANDMRTVAKLYLRMASRRTRKSSFVKELSKESRRLSVGRKSTRFCFRMRPSPTFRHHVSFHSPVQGDPSRLTWLSPRLHCFQQGTDTYSFSYKYAL